MGNRPKVQEKQRWDLLAGIWAVVFSLYAMMHAISPLLPSIIKDLGLTYGQAGFLYTVPIFIIAGLAYPIGILSDKVGIKKLISYGVALGVASAFLRTWSTNIPGFFFATILFGLGLAVCFVNLPRFVKIYFTNELSGLATGIYTSAITVGIGAGIAFTRLVGSFWNLDWRANLNFWGLIGLAAWIMWLFVSNRKWVSSGTRKAGPQFSGKYVLGKDEKKLSVALIGLLLSILNLLFFSTMGWLPTYLVELNWKAQVAAYATSVISFVEVPSVIVVPLISSRVGLRKPFIIGGYLTIALALLIVAVSPDTIWFLAPLFGIAFGSIFALLLVLPTEMPSVNRENIGKAAGQILSLGYIGGVIGPTITGVLKDASGTFSGGFVLLILMAIFAALLSLKLPETGRRAD